MIHIQRQEQLWIKISLALLVFFMAVVTVSAVVQGLVPPSNVQTIDPAKVSVTAPFDQPGVRQVGPNAYEAYYVARVFSFAPATLTVPVGAHVTFYVTSGDVVHGFSIPETGVNTMVEPGWVSEVSHTFKKRGTYLLLCHEYCGSGHQLMSAKVVVQ